MTMMQQLFLRLALLGLAWACLGTVQAAETGKPAIEFNRDVRPILSNHCFVCHGPDNNLRKADLRLDLEKDVFRDRDGYKILVPGKPKESELYQRIVSTDRSERMPPAKANK